MLVRKVPPNRRQCETFSIKWPPTSWRATTYFVNIARDQDGEAFEMFVSSSRPSTETADLIRDASILISLALQYGTSIKDLQGKISRLSSGAPATIIGAALDLVAQNDGAEPSA